MGDKNLRLLTEWMPLKYDQDVIEESKKNNKGKIMLRGILQRAETLNQNGRVYPKEVLEREIENYQKLIRENRALGECDCGCECVLGECECECGFNLAECGCECECVSTDYECECQCAPGECEYECDWPIHIHIHIHQNQSHIHIQIHFYIHFTFIFSLTFTFSFTFTFTFTFTQV